MTDNIIMITKLKNMSDEILRHKSVIEKQNKIIKGLKERLNIIEYVLDTYDIKAKEKIENRKKLLDEFKEFKPELIQ